MKEVKIAAVATQTFRGKQEYKNIKRTMMCASEAAEHGAQLACFLEGYPGPCSGPVNSGILLPKTPIEMMCELACP